MQEIRVAIIGHKGKMGALSLAVVNQMTGYKLVASIGREDNLANALQESRADVAIELTSNESVLKNTRTIIENKVRPLIGSSGLTHEEMVLFREECSKSSLGGLIIPNFSIGIACINRAALMLKEHFTDFSI